MGKLSQLLGLNLDGDQNAQHKTKRKSKTKRQKRLGLSLRGGGARAIGYLGVIKALEENNIKVHYIVGSSGGAIVGAAYAVGKSVKEIEDFLADFRIYSMFNLSSIGGLALTDNMETLEVARQFLGTQNIEDTKIKLWIQATNLNKKRGDLFASGDMAAAVVASSALPLLSKPIAISGSEYIDGDICAGFAADFLKSKGAEVVLGMMPAEEDFQSRKLPIWEQFFLPLSIAINSNKMNELALHPVDLLIEGFGADVSLLDFKKAHELVDEGYILAQKHIKTIKKLVF